MDGTRIEVGATLSTLRTSSRSVVEAVFNELEVDTPGAEYAMTYKLGKWDGKTRFLRYPSNQFLTGLLSRVIRACVAAGERPEVKWPLLMAKPPLAASLKGITLRDYQQAASDRAVDRRRLAIQCPTGGGKTEIGMDIVRRLGRPTLWLTHLKDLRTQTTDRFAEAMPDADLSQVYIGMVPTLARMLKTDREFFKQFEVLVMDEAHHAGADTWQSIALACENAHYRYGLSATLDTGHVVNNMLIEGVTGPTWTISSVVELAARKFLAEPHMRILRPDPMSYPTYEQVREKVAPNWRSNPKMLQRMTPSLYREMYRWGISENEPRNELILEAVVRHVSNKEKFFVACSRVPHAIGLGAYLQKRLRGYPIVALSSQTPDDERELQFKRFSNSIGGACIIATPFAREGINLPQIDAGFLAGGGESDIAIIQTLGRMLRVRPDKQQVLIYDVYDGRDDPKDKKRDKDWLANNFYTRLGLYKDQGLIIESESKFE